MYGANKFQAGLEDYLEQNKLFRSNNGSDFIVKDIQVTNSLMLLTNPYMRLLFTSTPSEETALPIETGSFGLTKKPVNIAPMQNCF